MEGNGQSNGHVEKDAEGIFRFIRRGKVKCALGDGAPFEFDLVLVYNQWVEICARYRNADGDIPADSTKQLDIEAMSFVASLSGQQDLVLAEVLIFLKWITDEEAKLRPLFTPKSREEPSSHDSTELILAQ